MAKSKGQVLRHISDPGHGWVEVPVDLCKKLRLGSDYPTRGNFFYLEEDDEATRLDRALKKHKLPVTFAGHEVDDFDSWLSGQQWPYIPAGIYDSDIDLVVHAMESLGTQMKQLAADDTYSADERKMWRAQRDDCQRLAVMFSSMR